MWTNRANRLRVFTGMALGAIAISAQDGAAQSAPLRPDVLKELQPVEAMYQVAPGDQDVRRRYASLLFKVGEFWRANDVIAPLATTASTNTEDLYLGARLAYGTGDYSRAEALYERLLALAAAGSEDRRRAVDGLALVYYQTTRFAAAKRLSVTQGRERDNVELMQRFEGEPYGIEWSTVERVATVPFKTQDPLPLMEVQVNGQPLEVILDTGGDLFIVDAEVAKRIGVEVIVTTSGKFAYTGGQQVEIGMGRVKSIKLGGVTMTNVPVQVLPWRSRGVQSDGVLTTSVLTQFLSTVDYANNRMIFRERSERGRRQLMESLEGHQTVRIPFTMFTTHFQFARGSLNGHEGLNFFMDSGLAMSLPFITVDETLQWLGIEKQPLQGSKYLLFPIESIGLGPLRQGATHGITNVLVDENMYWRFGFIFDGLLSHQFLRKYASWTIDFEKMSYFFDVDREVRHGAREQPARAKRRA